jgi:hypothetical protein
LKDKTPLSELNKIEIRLVPLATLAGSPVQIRTGNDKKDPLPAMVLINPTNMPVANNIGKYHQSIVQFEVKHTKIRDMKYESAAADEIQNTMWKCGNVDI